VKPRDGRQGHPEGHPLADKGTPKGTPTPPEVTCGNAPQGARGARGAPPPGSLSVRIEEERRENPSSQGLKGEKQESRRSAGTTGTTGTPGQGNAWIECAEPGCPNGIGVHWRHVENFRGRFICPNHAPAERTA